MTEKKNKAFFLWMLFAVFFFAFLISNPVSASSSQCKITFANDKGEVATETYRKWAKKAKRGEYIRLPDISKKGYRCYWVLKNGNTEKRYKPGARYKVSGNVKFCLLRCKIYNVRFYSPNGRHEFDKKRISAIKEKYITLPAVPNRKSYKGIGWKSEKNSKTVLKAGSRINITGDMKFYAVYQKSSSVVLREPDGRVYRIIYTSESKKAVFPAADIRSGDGSVVLGWSRRKGKTSKPDYYAGDDIPTKNGDYYMVVFPKAMDKEPTVLEQPSSYDHVYFVGDSRTVEIQTALRGRTPDNVSFICKSGEGLEWFQKYGYKKLCRKLKEQPRRNKKAVIINLGANDLKKSGRYAAVMTEVSKNLRKKYNCSMYYMSVNPVNSAMIKNRVGFYLRTEKQVEDFNRMIRTSLCSGKKKSYTYINTYDYLRKNGWISDRKNNSGVHDGTHYSNETSIRIYNVSIRFLNQNS